MNLSILCISKLEAHAGAFLSEMEGLARHLGGDFVLVADGDVATMRALTLFPHCRVETLYSKGYLESIHDQAIDLCNSEYILRIDDDERCSDAMVAWLLRGDYEDSDHWKFPRAHMWTRTSMIKTAQLWPDHQTRLSTKAKCKGRTHIHAGSPFGGGTLAPVALEHWKFVVKTQEERQRIADGYDLISNGAGTNGMLAFNLPELVKDPMTLVPWDGVVVE